jgi:hypothetical protein
MPQVPVWGPFRELELGDKLRFEPAHSFICSAVSAHWVRRFSGRLTNGQRSVSNPLNLR